MTTIDFVTPEQHAALGNRVTALETGGGGGTSVAALLVGQSNQSGRGSEASPEAPDPAVLLLDNAYVLRQATEPVDSNAGQLDTVSADTQVAKHSKNLRMGKRVAAATKRRVVLVPAAFGGTSIVPGGSTAGVWSLPASTNPFDRTLLLGSAKNRMVYAEQLGAAPGWMSWYQGEQDAFNGNTGASYVAAWRAIVGNVREIYPGLPVVLVQLANRSGTDYLNYWAMRETQRRTESLARTADSVPGTYMVVSHDLSVASDGVHLDRAGLDELAVRDALAVQQRVFRMDVDGTGPRLWHTNPVSRSGATITVRTTQALNSHGTYDGYWCVQDGATYHTLASGGIASVMRDPSDATQIIITLAAAPAGLVTVHCQPPNGRAAGTVAVNAPRSATVQPGLTYALPLPAFSVTI